MRHRNLILKIRRHFRNLMFETYSLVVYKITKFNITPYYPNGSVQWENFVVLAIGCFFNVIAYSIIMYCGIKMHFNMQKMLARFSMAQQNIQKQLLRALVAQSIGPTIFLVFPAVPFLMSPLLPPLFDLNIDVQSGWIFCIFGSYSSFDTIVFMVIVK